MAIRLTELQNWILETAAENRGTRKPAPGGADISGYELFERCTCHMVVALGKAARWKAIHRLEQLGLIEQLTFGIRLTDDGLAVVSKQVA